MLHADLAEADSDVPPADDETPRTVSQPARKTAAAANNMQQTIFKFFVFKVSSFEFSEYKL